MRQKLTKTLLLTFVATLFAGLFCVSPSTVFADASTTLQTEFYLPSSPIEFYDLVSPVGVSYNDGNYAFSEYYDSENDLNDVNSIVIYNKNTKQYTKIKHDTISNITCVEQFENFVLYVSGSMVYYVNINELDKTPVLSDVYASTFISINGNTLLTNTNNSLKLYTISIDNGALIFTHRHTILNESFIGYVDEFKNVYYQNANGFSYYSFTDNTIYSIVKNELKTAISMVVYGNYLYFTTTDGVYKLEISQNKQPELIIGLGNQTTLKNVLAPQGIAVKDGKLLIADSTLNAIQEYDLEKSKFTDFAITTESTADYRLTNKAEKIFVSKNYLYALDVSNLNETQTKRILKKPLNGNGEFEKIDLSFLYKDNPEYQIKKFVCSDEHVLIYDGTYLTLYKQVNGTLVKALEPIQNDNVTAIDYLDGNFYYSHTAKSANLEFDYSSIYEIVLPTETNELTDIKIEKLTKDEEINGIVEKMSVDVFSNVYLLCKDGETEFSYNLIRYYANTISASTLITLDSAPLNIQTDFAGNVYILKDNNAISKYTFDKAENKFLGTDFTIELAGGTKIKDFSLSYRSNAVYYLSNACILKNGDELLQVSNLSAISANGINEKSITSDVKFLTVTKNVKLFKVELKDFVIDGNNKYFNSNIEPITELNTARCYPLIAEIGSEYYLISYSTNIVALVRQTSVTSQVGTTVDATIISKENYGNFNIAETDLQKAKRYVSNDEYLLAKPVYNQTFALDKILKDTEVYLIKEYAFNGKKFTLISLTENGEPCGYLPSGYLVETTNYVNPNSVTTTQTIGNNAKKTVTDSIMILLIGFTLTFTALFIEYKLLFKTNDK